MNCIIDVRVEKRVPSTENMTSSFTLPVNDQVCSVSYSAQRDRNVKAYLVPKDIAAFQQLPKKAQKDARHAAMNEIRKRLG